MWPHGSSPVTFHVLYGPQRQKDYILILIYFPNTCTLWSTETKAFLDGFGLDIDTKTIVYTDQAYIA